MSINVSSLTPTEAKQYWYDYNNGNSNGISEAEYQSILTKFRSYITSWENDVDENGYSTGDTPEERLNFDADDAGFWGDGKGALGIADVAETAGAATGDIIVSSCTNFGNVSLIVAAALELAMAIATKSASPNKDAVAACETAQDELYTEQANLANQVLVMEEMQEEMEALQELALETNEEGQSDIADMEGLYNYYYTKYQNGTATDREIALMKALGAQMQSTQSTTNDETIAINEEIVSVGDGYEEVSSNISATNEFTDYVSDIDEATKKSAIAQGTLLTVSAAASTVTAVRAAVKAAALGSGIFTSWLAVLYIAAAASAGTAAYIFGDEAKTQFSEYRPIAEDTIDLRENTQELSAQTTEYQEISTEYWEETVEVTNEENLYTLTPTYATPTSTGSTDSTEDATAGTSVKALGLGTQSQQDGTGTTSAVDTEDTEEKDKFDK